MVRAVVSGETGRGIFPPPNRARSDAAPLVPPARELTPPPSIPDGRAFKWGSCRAATVTTSDPSPTGRPSVNLPPRGVSGFARGLTRTHAPHEIQQAHAAAEHPEPCENARAAVCFSPLWREEMNIVSEKNVVCAVTSHLQKSETSHRALARDRTSMPASERGVASLVAGSRSACFTAEPLPAAAAAVARVRGKDAARGRCASSGGSRRRADETAIERRDRKNERTTKTTPRAMRKKIIRRVTKRSVALTRRSTVAPMKTNVQLFRDEKSARALTGKKDHTYF